MLTVVRQVASRLGKKFTHYLHGLCYKHFNARPPGHEPAPGAWDIRYCRYDALHKDYAYEPAWVDFLVSKLSDPATYSSILETKAARNGK